MTFGGKKATGILLVGDLLFFCLSLWVTLLLRYWEIPGSEIFLAHLRVFGGLFFLWALVFLMAGLYGKQAILSKGERATRILRTQFVNIVLAALFFFLMPGIGLTPKTNLAIYLVISVAVIFVWRLWLFPRLTRPISRERAALIGAGPEVDELISEVNGNHCYRLEFCAVVSPEAVAKDFDTVWSELSHKKVTLLVVDTANEMLQSVLPKVYDAAFAKRACSFGDFYDVYEEVFDRVPLSLLTYEWFLLNLSQPASGFYDAMKRVIDIVGGLVMGLVTLVATPFVFLALRAEGKGEVFISQERFGRWGRRITVYKFRSMSFNHRDSGKWVGEGENKITRVGAFLRRTSLDEFPQFINILRGDLSLVGPRNDTTGLALRLAENIPYYMVRYGVKPGLTGWAQINQRYEPGNISPQSIEETKTRLSYDFYYIKHRSLGLDILVALQTVKRMFFRVSAW